MWFVVDCLCQFISLHVWLQILLNGLLGHEWDEDIDNGFRPSGLIHLSETHVDNVMYIQVRCDFISILKTTQETE